MRKRERVELLLLSYRCLVTVNFLLLFLTVPWAGLQYVIVVFPDRTHLHFEHCDQERLKSAQPARLQRPVRLLSITCSRVYCFIFRRMNIKGANQTALVHRLFQRFWSHVSLWLSLGLVFSFSSGCQRCDQKVIGQICFGVFH